MRIPLQIRTHLIPFLYEEMEGSLTNYISKSVMKIDIKENSSIGKYIFNQLNENEKKQKYIIKLVLEKKSINTYNGLIYKVLENSIVPLHIPEEKVLDINNLLEDLFRVAFTYYVNGSVENNNDKCVKLAVNRFIDKYDLLEMGFTVEGLRRQYYRYNDKKLKKIQQQPSNRVPDYNL